MSEETQYYTYLLSRSRLGYLYRNYWLYPRLTKSLKGLALDVGCGIGDMLAFRPNTVGTDINSSTVGYCVSRGLQAKQMRPNELPFTNASFDSILLDNVMEHVENPSLLLEEIRRVLKDGGTLLVGIPGEHGWKIDPDHKVEYTEESLIERVEAAGFKHVESFFTPLWKSMWLSKRLRQYCIYTTYVVVTDHDKS
jgi:SAM-dependent methyltransferase